MAGSVIDVHGLLYRILMGAGEGDKGHLPGIGMTRMYRQAVEPLVYRYDLVYIVEVELRVDALAEHIEGDRHDIGVAGAFAVAEQRALDPVRPGQKSHLGGGHAGAAVVVGMDAYHHVLTVFDMLAHILYLVCIDVYRCHLYR